MINGRALEDLPGVNKMKQKEIIEMLHNKICEKEREIEKLNREAINSLNFMSALLWHTLFFALVAGIIYGILISYGILI